MPKAFSELEKERIQARLMEQGYRLFSAYGLKKTNVEEIARAVGISKGAFYNFYPSKEALFMAVIEEAEHRVRRQILSAVDRPGPSPRARLYAVLKEAFDLFHSLPILRFLTGSDFDLLLRSVPAEALQEHMLSDQAFFAEMIVHCQEVGISIQAPPDQIAALLYQLVPALLSEDDMDRLNFPGSAEMLLELVAAFSLGEVNLELSVQPRVDEKEQP